MSTFNTLKKLLGYVRLNHEVEAPEIINESIEKAVVFRGTNLWILIFAVFIASVGLNMNSTAVIIGAMLISPLMGPINGIGYSIATYDFQLLRKSMINYAFAFFGALFAATLYFLITPIHTEHSELLARTSPTIYDVFIALFGGLAGIVAISSKNKGNVIPGVAIATALMPPLCTAGYGIATLKWDFFFGALYLFLINSVFIALSSMLVSQLLRFPKKTFLLSKEIKNTQIIVVAIILLTVIPSIIFGVRLVQKEKFKAGANEFVEKVKFWQGNYLLGHKINEDTRKISLIYGGDEMDDKSLVQLQFKGLESGIDTASIEIQQGIKTNDNSDIFESFEKEKDIAQAELQRLNGELDLSKKYADSLLAIPNIGDQLLGELRILYPEIQSLSYATGKQFIDSNNVENPQTVIVLSSEKRVREKEQEKIQLWLQNRIGKDEIILKF